MSDGLPIEIDVAKLNEMLQNEDDFVLLDVREQSECETAKIEGSIFFPMSEFGDRVKELDAYREKLMVIHCHHGGRSMRVLQALKNLGFTKLQNLAGGIDQWSVQIDPSVPRY